MTCTQTTETPAVWTTVLAYLPTAHYSDHMQKQYVWTNALGQVCSVLLSLRLPSLYVNDISLDQEIIICSIPAENF